MNVSRHSPIHSHIFSSIYAVHEFILHDYYQDYTGNFLLIPLLNYKAQDVKWRSFIAAFCHLYWIFYLALYVDLFLTKVSREYYLEITIFNGYILLVIMQR